MLTEYLMCMYCVSSGAILKTTIIQSLVWGTPNLYRRESHVNDHVIRLMLQQRLVLPLVEQGLGEWATSGKVLCKVLRLDFKGSVGV